MTKTQTQENTITKDDIGYCAECEDLQRIYVIGKRNPCIGCKLKHVKEYRHGRTE